MRPSWLRQVLLVYRLLPLLLYSALVHPYCLPSFYPYLAAQGSPQPLDPSVICTFDYGGVCRPE